MLQKQTVMLQNKFAYRYCLFTQKCINQSPFTAGNTIFRFA